MAIDKKELDKELELVNKGAEVLKERLDKVVLIEMHLDDIEKRLSERINKIEQLILKHDTIIGMHTGHFKEIADSLETNLSIIKQNDERFKRHVNESYDHDI